MSESTYHPIRVAAFVGAVAMLIGQVIFVSQQFDAYTIANATGATDWRRVFAYFGDIPKLLAISAATYFLVRRRDITWKAREVFEHVRLFRFIPYLSVQWICYLIFVLLTRKIYDGAVASTPISAAAYLEWIALAASIIFFWLLALSPLRNIVGFLIKDRLPILLGACVAALILGLSLETQSLWGSLSAVTLFACKLLLNGYDTGLVTLDIPHKVLGLGDFVVEIAPVCSGYEGMGLITGLSALYLYVYRREFRFPNALLLLPIGALIAWILNCARIATLIVIGYQWSPQVAIGGFHSNSGWIGFILTACLLLFFVGRYRWFVSSGIRRPVFSMTAETSLLIPFVVAMATVLLTSAFSSSSLDLFYPVRVILIALAILWSRKFIDLGNFQISLWPVLMGSIVAVIWVLMSPVNNSFNQEIQQELAGLSEITAILWVVLRLVGATLMVPVAEEFAFRGYLLAKLSGSTHMTKGWLPVVPWAAAISAVSFGVLHESWLAGIMAGAAYTLIRLRMAHLGHAIVAHAATNLMICIYVLLSGNWSVL